MSHSTRSFWYAAVGVALAGWSADALCSDEAPAESYVRLALQHEAYGKEDARQQLLEAALLVDPDYAPAHWHLGHVRVGDEWLPAAEAQRRAADDEKLATYQKLRDEALADPRRRLILAKWSQKATWTDRANLHYASIVLDPVADARSRNEAMRKLDLVDVHGMLLTKEEVDEARKSAERIEAALKKWRGPLEKLRQKIEAEGAAGKDRAAAELAAIDDPAVIPVLESFLMESGGVFGPHLVARLGSFPQIESTQTLVRFAVLSPWENVRAAAIEQLKRRPMHEYVPMLLEGLVAPIRSRFFIGWGPSGALHYRHHVLRRNSNGDYLATRDHVTQAFSQPIGIPLRAGERVPNNLRSVDEANREIDMRLWLESLRVTVEAATYEQKVARENAKIFSSNELIFVALEQATGEMLGRDPADWQSWWQGYNEVLSDRPIYYEYFPRYSPLVSYYHQPFRSGSCFAAGTPVWTESGIVPLEKIKPGDRVLSQDINTGELAYKVVLRTTALPPTSATVRVTLNDEPITMTRAHVVWVNNRGWRMAKELIPGDRLHGFDGVRVVQSTEQLPPELEVYNLVVADFNTFFVGERGILVHDITYMKYRKPTWVAVPGFAWR